jgi:hypothetical protein
VHSDREQTACLTVAASDVREEVTVTGPGKIAARLAHRLGGSLDDRRHLDPDGRVRG